MCQSIGKGQIAERSNLGTLPRPMPTPRPMPSILSLTRLMHQRAIARADYLVVERDLYRVHGPTAARHLTDDQRRQLAYLAHRADWKHIARDATIANVRTLR